MKPCILFLTLYLISINLFSQTSYKVADYFDAGDSARTRAHAGQPGNYEVAAKINEFEIDPGGSLNLEVYFTGYGEIGRSKLMMFPSGEIFETNYMSNVTTSMKVDSIPTYHGYYKYIRWGNITQPAFDSNGKSNVFIYTILGAQFKKWKDNTIYIDANPRDSMDLAIISEMNIQGAPISYHLKTVDNLSGGVYEINLYFTYYNGYEWKGSNKIVRFKVKSFIERHEWIGWILGALAALLSIVFPIVEKIQVLFRKK